MSNALLHLTETDFDQVLNTAGDKPVMVDFWAPWCGPCRMVGPFVEQIAEEYNGKAVVAKVDVDEQPALAARFQVMTIPTIMVFKNGEVIERTVGAKPKQALAQMLDKQL